MSINSVQRKRSPNFEFNDGFPGIIVAVAVRKFRIQKIYESFNWKQQEIYSNTLRNFMHEYGLDWFDTFKNLRNEGELSMNLERARSWLHKFWKEILRSIPENSPLWFISDKRGLVVRAMNYLNLTEPFNEMIFLKQRFYENYQGYWSGSRPLFLDALEKILEREHQKKCGFDQQIPYLTKKNKLKAKWENDEFTTYPPTLRKYRSFIFFFFLFIVNPSIYVLPTF